MSEIIYSMVLLNGVPNEVNSNLSGGYDRVLRELKTREISIPDNWKIINHHMTIEFNRNQPLPQLLGEEVILKVVGYAQDKDVLCLVVEPPSNINVKNKVPHITVAVSPGTSPSYSNTLLDTKGYEKFYKPFFVHGTVAYSNGNISKISSNFKKFVLYCDLDGVLVDYQSGFKSFIQNLSIENIKKFCKFLDIEYKEGENPFEDIISRDDLEKKFGKKGKKLSYKISNSFNQEWWANLDWIDGGKELWNHIKKYDPIILSAPSSSESSYKGKLAWVANNLNISPTRIILDSNKYEYVNKDTALKEREKMAEKRILIDDTPKKINGWVEKGGIGILHKNNSDTISQLNTIIKT